MRIASPLCQRGRHSAGLAETSKNEEEPTECRLLRRPFKHAFDVAGSYPYYCQYDPSEMVGTIIVTN
jgi:plastocyanin